MLHIHQYNMYILYKPGTDLNLMDWLFWHNYTENENHKIDVWQSA